MAKGSKRLRKKLRNKERKQQQHQQQQQRSLSAEQEAERREDILGRRRSRLEERSIRDEVGTIMSDRGFDIDKDVLKQAQKNASQLDGYSQMSSLQKRNTIFKETVDLESTRMAHKSMPDSVIEKPGSVKYDANGNFERYSEEAQEIFNKNKQSAIKELSDYKRNKSYRETNLEPVPVTKSKDMKFEYTADGKGGEYAAKNATRRAQFAESNFNHARTNEKVRSAVQKKLGIDDDKMDAFMGMDKDDRKTFYGKQVETAALSPKFVDKMMGNKVPHIAGGALGTAWLVNQMSANKGQQSNAQLYGQQGFY